MAGENDSGRLPPEVEKRLTTLEVKLEIFQQTHVKAIGEIADYMKDGRTWRDDVNKTLTLVVNNQGTSAEKFTEYTAACDKDRTAITKDVTSLKDSRNRQLGMAYVGSALISTVLGLLGFYYEHK